MIFAVGIASVKIEGNVFRSEYYSLGISAKNKDEAKEIAMEKALKMWPTQEGYTHHQTSVAQLDEEWVKNELSNW